MKRLLQEGTPFNCQNELRLGWMPLHHAAYNSQAGIVEFLISRGANANPKTTDDNRLAGIRFPAGLTPLDIAFIMGCKQTAAFLEKAGGKRSAAALEQWEPLPETATGIRMDEGYDFPILEWLAEVKEEEEKEEADEEDMEDEESENDIIDTLTAAESRALYEYINKETHYEIPTIKAVISTDFLRFYIFFYICEMGGPYENHDRYCLIGMKKGGQQLHRFGHFEMEDVKGRDWIADKDIDYFNRMIRDAKFKAATPEEAFRAAALFVKLTGFYKNEPAFAANGNPEWHPPIFRQSAKGYLFHFFTRQDLWRLAVSRKGKIKLEFRR